MYYMQVLAESKGTVSATLLPSPRNKDTRLVSLRNSDCGSVINNFRLRVAKVC